jgi:hypothetical protein
MTHSPDELDKVLTHPLLSDDAKTLFLMLARTMDFGEDYDVKVPEFHWWTQRTTESLLCELAYFGVMSPVRLS